MLQCCILWDRIVSYFLICHCMCISSYYIALHPARQQTSAAVMSHVLVGVAGICELLDRVARIHQLQDGVSSIFQLPGGAASIYAVVLDFIM